MGKKLNSFKTISEYINKEDFSVSRLFSEDAMAKLLKYSILLITMFFISQYINKFDVFKGLPSFALPEEFPEIFSQIIPVASIKKPQKQSTADLIAKIQNNQLQEIQKIWAELGIKSDLFKKSNPALKESFNLELPSGDSQLYVYLIADEQLNDWQYLFFNIKNRVWNLYGYLDLPGQASSEPISRMVTIEDRSWLVITSRTDSPNLPGMYQDRWYDLQDNHLRESLRYHLYQDQTEPNFIKRYSANIVETGVAAGSYYIDLNTKIAFLNSRTSQSDLDAAFSVSRKVRYLWDNSGQTFRNHSHRQEDELHNYGADEILIHNYFQIGNLAVNGTPSQRGQIKQFVQLCGNIPEKREILKYLAR